MRFDELIKSGYTMLDGATGTELMKRGLSRGDCPEVWAIENSAAVIELQRGYVDAGTQVLFAPTFGANRVALRAHGVTRSVRDMCRDLVAISREAGGDRTLVAGDIAPCGRSLPPMGTTGFDELVDIYAEQAAALDEAGVDLFGIETQMSLGEARAAVIAAKSVSDKPVFVTFTCTESGKTLYGADLTAALLSLQELGTCAFGINCCGDFSLIEKLISEMRPHARVPLAVKPNAGKPDTSSGSAVYKMTAGQFGANIPALAAAGASIFGGCCGPDKTHVAAASEALSKLPFNFSPNSSPAAASEYRVVQNPGSAEICDLGITDDIMTDAVMAEAEGAEMLRVTLRDEKDVSLLLENQFAIKPPLVVVCNSKPLLERFLREYSGKPVIEN